jgi:hypothetical protein
VKTGELLILETGEYSDKQWHGPYRVLKDFTIGEARDAYVDQWKPEPDGWREQPDPDGFSGWLVAQQFIEHVDAKWVYIGSYGRLELDGDLDD